MLPRVDLARLPTPLHRAERLGRHLGIELWIKRDDLSGAALSGNLLLDRLVGAEIVALDPADWPARDARMAALAAGVRAAGGRSYVGAEGPA